MSGSFNKLRLNIELLESFDTTDQRGSNLSRGFSGNLGGVGSNTNDSNQNIRSGENSLNRMGVGNRSRTPNMLGNNTSGGSNGGSGSGAAAGSALARPRTSKKAAGSLP